MKKIANLVGKLFAIAAVSALILGLANINTQPVIEKRQEELFKSSFSVAYPTGKDFKVVEEKVNDNLNSVIEVSDGSSVVGYIFNATGYGGYGGAINFIVGISNDGIVQGFKALSHSETKGYGSKIEEEPFINGVKDVNVSLGVSYGKGNKEKGEIEAISGATKSSSAVANGLHVAAIKMSQLSEKIEPIGEKLEPYFASNYSEIYADADSFKEVKNLKGKYMVRIVEAYKGEEKLGEIVQLKANGYGGPINILLGVDENKVIKTYKLVSHNETPQLGAVIEEDEYIKNMVGKSLSQNVKLKKKPIRSQDILIISGATITTNAMKEALNEAVRSLKTYHKSNVESQALNLSELIAMEKNESNIDYTNLFEGVTEVSVVENVKKTGSIVGVHKAMALGKELGIIIDVKGKGFGGDLEFGILVDETGIIKDFKIYSHKESPDYGDYIEKSEYKSIIVGKNLSKIDKFTSSSTPTDNSIHAISGATFTTDGMLESFNSVLEFYKGLK